MIARLGRRRRPARSRWRLAGDVLLALALLFLVALIAARGLGVASRTLEGRFTVVDGDSLMFGAERLRLEGIDAPEIGQTCRRGDEDHDCGRAARDALRGLMLADGVSCRGGRLDAYQRLLVRCADGETDINARMVETGWAVAYGDYASDERAAREAGRGLWAGEFERPQAWRERQGRAREETHGGVMALFDAIRHWLPF